MQVYGLNAKIAELESEMHDVVRELVRTNLDVQNFKVSVFGEGRQGVARVCGVV